MSMSTYVYGIVPVDDKYIQMRDIYNTCIKAGVSVPPEVKSFFDHLPPDDKGVIVDLGRHPCQSVYKAEMQEGIEVDISKVPKPIKIIRFVNSY